MATYTGVLECDVIVGAGAPVDSLKHKRAILRPVLARLRRLQVAAAETGFQDLHRRALIAVATVASDPGQVQAVLDTGERQLAGEMELELLSARRRTLGPDDE